MPAPTLEDRFVGCLLGLALGDALGGRFEGQTPDYIAQRYPTPQSLIDIPPVDHLHYTDDTQMTIAVAESLIDHGEIAEATLCKAFVANYTPSRGYGWGARAVLNAMEDGKDYRAIAESHFPGGSFGNGAAMRVAPVGLAFHDDLDRVWAQARLSALPTHLHPLGIEGAQLLALAVALLVRSDPLDLPGLVGELIQQSQSDVYREKLERVRRLRSAADVAALGNRITAVESVVTAIGCFALAPASYGDAVGQAVLLGGDTDTIAAMTGALSGAFLGRAALPPGLVGILEDDAKGRRYIEGLARRLRGALVQGGSDRG